MESVVPVDLVQPLAKFFRDKIGAIVTTNELWIIAYGKQITQYLHGLPGCKRTCVFNRQAFTSDPIDRLHVLGPDAHQPKFAQYVTQSPQKLQHLVPAYQGQN
ncbi:MAG: hypothetical protein MK171_13050 [Pirellulales bacterium]|nr:hypothetical protein [Pirellulales bacterium]